MHVVVIMAVLCAGLGGTLPETHTPGVSPRVLAAATGDTLWVDLQQSVLRWKGTKFWGLGKHEGIVRLATGRLWLHEETLQGGIFVIDMTSIEVTDIPAHEPVPRRRLRDHLMSDDFFAVATYPTAVFVLTRAQQRTDHTYLLTGALTMRGQTHPVTFEAEMQALSHHHLEATAQFSINRHRWNVSYRGSRLTDDLVDDEIHLDLYLVASR